MLILTRLLLCLILLTAPAKSYAGFWENCKFLINIATQRNSAQKNFERMKEANFEVSMYKKFVFMPQSIELLPEFKGYNSHPKKFLGNAKAMKLLYRASLEAAGQGFVFSDEKAMVDQYEVHEKILDIFMTYITRKKE